MDKAKQILEEYLRYYRDIQIMAPKSEEIKNRILSIEEAIAEFEAQDTKSCLSCIAIKNCVHHKLVTDPLLTMNEVNHFLQYFYCSNYKNK